VITTLPCGTDEVDYAEGITARIPYGVTAILWNKELIAKTFINQDKSIIGREVCLISTSLNFLIVYMTSYCKSNNDECINYLSKILTFCDEIDSLNVNILERL